MNHKTDDILYGLMRCASTSKPNEGEMDSHIQRFEYLTLKDLTQFKPTFASICGCSTRTINRKLEQLEEAGLIKHSSLTLTNPSNNQVYTYPCYIFPYDYDGNYKLITKEMLEFLINTRNNNVIRIYIYLLSKYEWKPEYVFTIDELKQVLGFKPTYTKINKPIKQILVSLKNEGIINYEERWYDVEGSDSKTKRLVLLSVIKVPLT